MWGTGVNDENTIPSLFSVKSKKKYRSVNYGESGYSAYQEYLFFNLKLIEGIKPQLVS